MIYFFCQPWFVQNSFKQMILFGKKYIRLLLGHMDLGESSGVDEFGEFLTLALDRTVAAGPMDELKHVSFENTLQATNTTHRIPLHFP
jgi:hypothetical protein